MNQRPYLSHIDAMTVIELLRGQLEPAGHGATVAVVDSHGELLALLRTDGCPLPSINNAIHKAFTAAREGVESAEIGASSKADGFPITNFGDLRYTGWGGGVPIRIAGEVVGAVGVSGLPEEEDIVLAKSGVALVEAKYSD